MPARYRVQLFRPNLQLHDARACKRDDSKLGSFIGEGIWVQNKRYSCNDSELNSSPEVNKMKPTSGATLSVWGPTAHI